MCKSNVPWNRFKFESKLPRVKSWSNSFMPRTVRVLRDRDKSAKTPNRPRKVTVKTPTRQRPVRIKETKVQYYSSVSMLKTLLCTFRVVKGAVGSWCHYKQNLSCEMFSLWPWNTIIYGNNILHHLTSVAFWLTSDVKAQRTITTKVHFFFSLLCFLLVSHSDRTRFSSLWIHSNTT